MAWNQLNDQYYVDQSTIIYQNYSQDDSEAGNQIGLMQNLLIHQNIQGDENVNVKPKLKGKTQLNLFSEVLWLHGNDNPERNRVFTQNFKIIYGEYLTAMSDKTQITTYIQSKQQQLQKLSQIACKSYNNPTLIPVFLAICTVDMFEFFQKQLVGRPQLYNKCILFRSDLQSQYVYANIRQAYDVIKSVQILERDLIKYYVADLYKMYEQCFNLELNPNIFIADQPIPTSNIHPPPNPLNQHKEEKNQQQVQVQQQQPLGQQQPNEQNHSQQKKQQKNQQDQKEQENQQKKQQKQQQKSQQSQVSNKQLKQKVEQKVVTDLFSNDFYIFVDPLAISFIVVTTPQTKQLIQEKQLKSQSFLIMTHEELESFLSSTLEDKKIILISTEFHKYFELFDQSRFVHGWVRCMWGCESLELQQQERYGDCYENLRTIDTSFEDRVFNTYSIEEFAEKLEEIQNSLENQVS